MNHTVFLFESKSKFYFGREKAARMQVLGDRIGGEPRRSCTAALMASLRGHKPGNKTKYTSKFPLTHRLLTFFVRFLFFAVLLFFMLEEFPTWEVILGGLFIFKIDVL